MIYYDNALDLLLKEGVPASGDLCQWCRSKEMNSGAIMELSGGGPMYWTICMICWKAWDGKLSSHHKFHSLFPFVPKTLTIQGGTYEA